METFYFLKFWKPNPSSIAIPSPLLETDNKFELEEEEDDEEEESFFDLEITTEPNTKTQLESSKLYSNETKTEPMLALSSPTDPISKRKILPVQPISKPQSPIALLKSAPKFGASIFKKPKSNSTQKTAETESCISTVTQKQKASDLKSNDSLGASNRCSKLTRDNSSRKDSDRLRSQSSEDTKTDRSSKDVINKYLKLIKPLYLKVSKKYGEKGKLSGAIPVAASPTSSPAVSMFSPRKEKQGIRVVCKHLGKSKSATAAMAAASPVNRRDDSLLVQADGIQSAILHCKRSFNSRDSSCLSRSTSWTSSSPSMSSYSSDSSLLSWFAIESHERSARSSIEEEAEELSCF